MTTLEEMKKRRPVRPEHVDALKKQLRSEVRAYRLRELREEYAVTQVELAKQLDVSQNRVSKIEHGDIERTQVETLRRYVEALGASLILEVKVGDDRFTLA